MSEFSLVSISLYVPNSYAFEKLPQFSLIALMSCPFFGPMYSSVFKTYLKPVFERKHL
jgi:hypothetical protein